MAALPYTSQRSLTPTMGARTAAMLPTQSPVARLSLTRGPISVLQGGISSSVVQPSAGLTSSGIATSVWNELKSLHTTPGTFGYLLDAQVSLAGGGTPPTAAAIADAVWDEAQSGHTTAGTFGKYLDAQASLTTPTTIWAYVIESSKSAAELMRLALSVLTGKKSVTGIGTGTITVTFRDLADSKNRVVATQDEATGERLTVTTRDGT